MICLSGSNTIRTHNHLFRKGTLNHFNWPNDWAVLWVFIYTMHLTVCYYHDTYGFESESALCSLPESQGTSCSKQAPYLKFWIVLLLLSTSDMLQVNYRVWIDTSLMVVKDIGGGTCHSICIYGTANYKYTKDCHIPNIEM